MKKNYTIYQVDAFTREKLAGNPAGVVPDARGLTEGQMQRIARELNNSETGLSFSREKRGSMMSMSGFSPPPERYLSVVMPPSPPTISGPWNWVWTAPG